MYLRLSHIEGQNLDRISVTLLMTLDPIQQLHRLRYLGLGELGEGDIAAHGHTLQGIRQKTLTRRTLRKPMRLVVAVIQMIRGVTELGVTPLTAEAVRTKGALGLVEAVEVIRTVGRAPAVDLLLLVTKPGTTYAHPQTLQILLVAQHRQAKTIPVHQYHLPRHLKDLYQSPKTS